jgi:peptidoglycan hydrolase-like protein with peptidoglycan-binding domain
MTQDARPGIVAWAKWGVANKDKIHYQQIRPFPLTSKLPLTIDCSGFATLCYFLAGAPDPNGLNYNHYGYTGTLLQRGRKISLAEAQPGDLIVYGAGTGEHVAIVVENDGRDPMTISMGQESDPSYVRVSQDGRKPQTYLRFNTATNNPKLPGTSTPKQSDPTPKPAQSHTTIYKGSSGSAVILVQKELGIPADGVFGDQTETAVKNFQRQMKIQVDGIVGPATWKALGV